MTTSVTETERAALARRLGPMCTLIASAMVKLYLASPDSHAKQGDDPILSVFPDLSNEEWTYTQIMGFVVLLTDELNEGLYIRIYDYKKMQRRFEYEIYFDMEYRLLDAQFHVFEMESCVAGLCFSVKSDAMLFYEKLVALKPSMKDSAATVLRKIRNSTLIKDQAAYGLSGRRSDGQPPANPQTRSNAANDTPEQQTLFKEYEEAHRKYEADLAKYRAEQEALAKYEKEKRAYEEKYRAYIEWASESSGQSSSATRSSFAMPSSSSLS